MVNINKKLNTNNIKKHKMYEFDVYTVLDYLCVRTCRIRKTNRRINN